jgi:arylformamidase
MKIHDISVLVHDDMVIWPGLVPTRLTEHERIQNGQPVNVTNLASCAHVGSHVDAPFHHYAEGKTIEQVPLSRYVGAAYVADLTDVEWEIRANDVSEALNGVALPSILLLKTRNSTDLPTWKRFDEKYVYIAPDAAEEIVRRGVKTIGFDHLAVEGYHMSGGPTHKVVLGEADVTIVEGLDLSRINSGHYFFSAAPVRLKGADGAPTRAYLIEGEGGAPPGPFGSLEDV